MRTILAAAAAVLVVLVAGLSTAGLASADLAGPPFVDHTEWAHWGDLSSLRVYPTAAAREISVHPDTTAQADEAWAEVLAQSPDADLPGMRAQFMCHWSFAEIAQPGKTSWNLEPWRPEVDENQMIAAGCNPGGTEEPF